MRLGLRKQVNQFGSGAFNPSSLALSGWWESPYTPTTLPAKASAGTSGGNGPIAATATAMTPAATSPTAGPNLNGFATELYDGVANVLENANNLSTFISASGSSLAVLFYATAAQTSVGLSAYYLDPALLVDSVDGYLALTYSSSGVSLGSYDINIGDFNSVAIPTALNSWHLAQARWSSTAIELRVDSGAWTQPTVSRALSLVGSGFLRTGRNYDTAAAKFTGRIASRMTAKTKFTDAQFNNIKAYLNAKFALAL